MKKITLNDIIIGIIVLSIIPLLLLNLITIPIIITMGVFGYIIAYLLIWLAKKINSTRLLKSIFYSAFIFTIILITYHYINTYTSYLIDFRGYRDFEQFIYYNPFKFSTFPLKFIWETFVLIIMADVFFIGLGAGFLTNLYLNISGLKK